MHLNSNAPQVCRAFFNCGAAQLHDSATVDFHGTSVSQPGKDICEKGCTVLTFTIEMSRVERALLAKILDSYLAELRQEIAATKRDTSDLHAEELSVKSLQKKVSEAH